jgi:hypothetical protein
MNFYTFSVAISLERKIVKRLKLKPKILGQLFPCLHLISGMRSFLRKCCPVANFLVETTPFMVRFQILTATSMEMVLFLDVAPCSLVRR